MTGAADGDGRDGVDRARWDAAHAASDSPTLSRIKRETICASLPDGVEPTTLWPSWPLEQVAAALGLDPGETLVDLACGRGEVGLWIARHLGVAWVGVDPSPVGLTMAAGAAGIAGGGGTATPGPSPLAVAVATDDGAESGPAHRGAGAARVVKGHFLATGLADATADAVLILDALHFAPDLPATLAEVRRILRPGRRLVVVGPQMRDPRPSLRAAGFAIERDEQTPGWLDLMALFLERVHADAEALRAELDARTAGQLLTREMSQLAGVGHGLLVGRAPAA